MDEQVLKRLDRIDAKVDAMANTLSQLAVLEERLLAHAERMHVLGNQIQKFQAVNVTTAAEIDKKAELKASGLETRVRALEEKSASGDSRMVLFDRLFWLLITSIVGTFFYFLKSGGS